MYKTKFLKKSNVEDAIDTLIDLYKNNKIKVNDSNYTVKWMKRNNIK